MTNALYALAPGSLRIMRGGACVASISRGDMNPDDTADFAEKITAALNAFNPNVVAFEALPWSLRRAQVGAALDTVLRSLLAAESTTAVTEHVAKLLLDHASTDKERKMISADLMKLAPKTPEATRSEATFESFGRTMRRWVWSPRT